SWITQAVVLALLTPLMLRCSRAFPIEGPKRLRVAAFHICVSLAIAVFAITASALASGFAFEGQGTSARDLAKIFTNVPAGFHENILAYWIVICACFTLDCYRRYEEGRQRALRLELQAAQLSSQLLEAQVRALHAQLQPRFLFSTMNAIMTVVRQREDEQAE